MHATDVDVSALVEPLIQETVLSDTCYVCLTEFESQTGTEPLWRCDSCQSQCHLRCILQWTLRLVVDRRSRNPTFTCPCCRAVHRVRTLPGMYSEHGAVPGTGGGAPGATAASAANPGPSSAAAQSQTNDYMEFESAHDALQFLSNHGATPELSNPSVINLFAQLFRSLPRTVHVDVTAPETTPLDRSQSGRSRRSGGSVPTEEVTDEQADAESEAEDSVVEVDMSRPLVVINTQRLECRIQNISFRQSSSS